MRKKCNMNIRDINKPVTSKTLNETMAKKFGTKINVAAFTLEQLQDARNKIRSKVFDIETNESFGGLPENKTYSKNKLFLDVLNAAISERENIQDQPLAEPVFKSPKGNRATGIQTQDEPEDKAKKVKSKPKPVEEAQSAAQKAAFQKMLDKKKGKKPAEKDEEVDESKPDFLDLDKDGDKKEPMKKAAKDAKKKKMDERMGRPYKRKTRFEECKEGYEPKGLMCVPVAPKPAGERFKESKKESKVIDEGKDIINNYYASLLKEGEEDKAELVMASKDMVDRLTGWMEDTAEMQTESMLELADAIRDEMGAQQSEAFTMAVKPALEQLYASMETTRIALTTGVGMLTGEGEAPPMDMGAEAPVDDVAMEPTDDMDMEADLEVGDEFGAAAPAAGGDDEAGRAKRESRMTKKKMLETSRRLGSILSKPGK